jgi:hypothetical protein
MEQAMLFGLRYNVVVRAAEEEITELPTHPAGLPEPDQADEHIGYCLTGIKRAVRAPITPEPTVAPTVDKTAFHAEMAVEKACGKCSGTGTYGRGAQDVATGAYEHSGQCCQCGGTGQMKKADNYRTAGYWRHRAQG